MLDLSIELPALHVTKKSFVSNEYESPKLQNWTYAFFNKYYYEPLYRRQALSFAYALVNEPVFVRYGDQLTGMIYQGCPGSGSPDSGGSEKFKEWMLFDSAQIGRKRTNEYLPHLCALSGEKNSPNVQHTAWLTGVDCGFGHIGWNWDWIISEGIEGLKKRIFESSSINADTDSLAFLEGVEIVLTAVEKWNGLHIDALRNLLNNCNKENTEEIRNRISICEHVPRFGARSFREAIQSFHFGYICTMFENPHGGNGPGRLDYYLWPWLKRDLENGCETPKSAARLVSELLACFSERLRFASDMWVETIVVGGSEFSESGNILPSINPLSHFLVNAVADQSGTHPALYMRIPENAPQEWLSLAGKYVSTGNNKAQILNDKAIISALVKAGFEPNDAIHYMCGGCMELQIQGKNGDLNFTSFFNTPKLLEYVFTGGVCLLSGCKIPGDFGNGLNNCKSFEELYALWERVLLNILTDTFRMMDIQCVNRAKYAPKYLLSSQISRCIERARGINNGGAQYEDFASAPLGIPNIADSLLAVKLAIFEKRLCSADELIDALKKNFNGYEILRKQLLDLPKFGDGSDEGTAMAQRVLTTVTRCYEQYRNCLGGRIRPMFMTFIFAPVAGAALGATPDGRLAGSVIAHGLTPQSVGMRKGLFTAMMSANQIGLEQCWGGATSMWDISPVHSSNENICGILNAFINSGGQMYHGNTVDIEDLKRAKIEPENYQHLIVRVGGYSGTFINLPSDVQDEIIARHRHI